MSDSENSTDNKTLDITLKLSQITTEEEFRDLAKDLLALVSSSPYENVQTAWNAKDHSFHIYAEVSEENTEALEVLVSAVQRFSENVDDDLKPLRDERFGVFSWSGYGSWETEVEVSDDLTFNLLIEAEERHRAGAVGAVRRFLENFGYRGHFVFRGSVCEIDDFDLATHQPASLLGHFGDRVDYAGYINNFIFVQPERSLPRVVPSSRSSLTTSVRQMFRS